MYLTELGEHQPLLFNSYYVHLRSLPRICPWDAVICSLHLTAKLHHHSLLPCFSSAVVWPHQNFGVTIDSHLSLGKHISSFLICLLSQPFTQLIFVQPLLMIWVSQLSLPLFAPTYTMPTLFSSVLHKNISRLQNVQNTLVIVVARLPSRKLLNKGNITQHKTSRSIVTLHCKLVSGLPCSWKFLI